LEDSAPLPSQTKKEKKKEEEEDELARVNAVIVDRGTVFAGAGVRVCLVFFPLYSFIYTQSREGEEAKPF